jgi:cytochrome c peroxidase
MKRTTMAALGVLVVGSVGFLFLVWRPGGKASSDTWSSAFRLTPATQILGEPIQPIPTDIKFEPRKVELGNKLFHDKRLSHDDTIACASCHSLDKGGTDQKSHSTGIGGAIGGINAPTVLNSGLNYKQFWNGRAETLEDQVNGPTHHPKEMGSNWDEILGKLRKDPEYVAKFAALYPDGIQSQNVRDAIATFERSLLTVDSPFDRYLRGETSAINDKAKAGYKLFKNYGCASCHQGMNVGGNMFQTFGVMADYFAKRGNVTDADLGRQDVTKREQDKHVFRVPSLRNIAQTGPYFHDGSEDHLPQAIEVMAKYQLGRYLTAKEVSEIREFLESLTGEVKGGAQ